MNKTAYKIPDNDEDGKPISEEDRMIMEHFLSNLFGDKKGIEEAEESAAGKGWHKVAFLNGYLAKSAQDSAARADRIAKVEDKAFRQGAFNRAGPVAAERDPKKAARAAHVDKVEGKAIRKGAFHPKGPVTKLSSANAIRVGSH